MRENDKYKEEEEAENEFDSIYPPYAVTSPYSKNPYTPPTLLVTPSPAHNHTPTPTLTQPQSSPSTLCHTPRQ
jgi:hypothetical protein